MTGTRTLIFGATWCANEEKRELAKLWARVLARTSPECDILVIDCDSPFRPGNFLKEEGFSHCTTPVEEWKPDDVAVMFAPRESIEFKGSVIEPTPLKLAASFSNNIGHLSLGGGDGWGRSFCKGLEIAIASGYDYVAYIEPDLLFAPPVMPIIEKMHRCGVKAAAPIDLVYHFIANEIMFLNVEYLKQSRFVERYDWANPPPLSRETVPEKRCEDLLADELFILPLRGIRNDHGQLTRHNIRDRNVIHPMGLSYVTHCQDFALYEIFMDMHGLSEPVEESV